MNEKKILDFFYFFSVKESQYYIDRGSSVVIVPR